MLQQPTPFVHDATQVEADVLRRIAADIFTVAAVTLALFAESPLHSAETDRAPNIVFILADDMGYGDPACCNPQGRIATPHLDRLAQEGTRFTDAHSPGAVCVPTRYGLMTGRYPFRAELNLGRGPAISEGRLTLPALLGVRGYHTGMVGKWHLGFEGGQKQSYTGILRGGPRDRGFLSFFGIHASLDIPPYFYIRDRRAVAAPTGHVDASSSEGWSPIQGAFWRAGAAAPDFDHEQVLPRFTDESVRFLDSAPAELPFFLYVALPAPHTPWLPLPEFRDRSDVGMYGDFVMQVDAVVGRILAALEENQHDRNTLVIFTSDNGPVWYESDRERWNHSSAGPFRGMKGDAWEGGHRVPFLVRWPGVVPEGATCDSLICHTDMLATFADLVDLPLPEDAGLDSVSILPALRQPASSPEVRETLILKRNASVVRKGRWKLITHLGSGGFTKPRRIEPEPDGPTGQLYDLQADPGETNNVWQQHPDTVKALQAILATEQSR